MTEPTKDLIPVQSKELVQNALDFCSSVTEIAITTEDEYLSNCELTKKVAGYSKKVEQQRKAIVGPLNAEVKRINAYFYSARDPLKNLDEKLRKSLVDYTKAQKQKRLEAQRKAEAEAEKQRLKLAAQAEKDEEKSQEAAENGDIAKAEDLHLRSTVRRDMAEDIVPVVIPKAIPKVKGISYRTDWSAKITDKKKFIEYCLQNNQLHYLDINMKILNAFAKTVKDTVELPGVEFIDKSASVTR